MSNTNEWDKLIVQLLDNQTEEVISVYRTHNWSEALKFYEYILHNAADIHLYVDEEDIEDKYSTCEFIVEDIVIKFGGKSGLNALKIYVDTV